MNTKVIVVAIMIIGMASAASDHQLRFNSNGTFKIVQFTDIHFGELKDYDIWNQELMAKVIELE
jgi:hypothetical protein